MLLLLSLLPLLLLPGYLHALNIDLGSIFNGDNAEPSNISIPPSYHPQVLLVGPGSLIMCLLVCCADCCCSWWCARVGVRTRRLRGACLCHTTGLRAVPPRPSSFQILLAPSSRRNEPPTPYSPP